MMDSQLGFFFNAFLIDPAMLKGLGHAILCSFNC